MPDPVERQQLSDHWEPRAGEMHPVDQAFYDLAIKDRDYARTRVNSLMAENKRWLGLVRDLRAENETLKEEQVAFVRDLEKAQTENEELLAAQGRLSGWLNENRAEATKAWTEVERLREAIRTAPHAQHCAAYSPIFPGPCGCWKARALAPASDDTHLAPEEGTHG